MKIIFRKESKSPLLGVHEYIVEDLSGEFEAVFINLELMLSAEPARLTRKCKYHFVYSFLVNYSKQNARESFTS